MRTIPLAAALLLASGAAGCKSEFYFGSEELDPTPPPGPRRTVELHVDDDNTSGTEDGSAAHPFRSVARAVEVAAGKGTIKIARGSYVGNLRLEAASVTLLGGYEGGTAEQYARGAGMRWDVRSPRLLVTKLVGAGDDSVVTVVDGRATTLDGLVITGGTGMFDGDRYEGGGVYVTGGSFRLSDLVVEKNDVRHGDLMARGGGVSVDAADGVIEGCVIRDNVALRGAGVAAGNVGKLVLRDNVIERNLGVDDHGGGLFMAGEQLLLERNLIKDNSIGRRQGDGAWGWGGGAYFHSKGTRAQLVGNVITGNDAPTLGSGLFVDNQAEAWSSRDLFYANKCNLGGVAVYVDGEDDSGATGSRMWIDGATIAEHPCRTRFGGGAVLAQGDSVVTVVNSIMWNNGTRAREDRGTIVSEALADFATDGSTARVDVDWSLAQTPVVWREKTGDLWEEVPITGRGNLFLDPMFASPKTGDFHLRSAFGRWDRAGGERGAWVKDPATSPAIDRADPGAPASFEPKGSERRRDLGCFGGTPEASLGGAP